jgi:hypothetical protein
MKAAVLIAKLIKEGIETVDLNKVVKPLNA